jgi:hypothetical protein
MQGHDCGGDLRATDWAAPIVLSPWLAQAAKTTSKIGTMKCARILLIFSLRLAVGCTYSSDRNSFLAFTVGPREPTERPPRKHSALDLSCRSSLPWRRRFRTLHAKLCPKPKASFFPLLECQSSSSAEPTNTPIRPFRRWVVEVDLCDRPSHRSSSPSARPSGWTGPAPPSVRSARCLRRAASDQSARRHGMHLRSSHAALAHR